MLTVGKLDRLGRNTQHVLAVLEQLTSRGIGFRSLTAGLHTDGPMGTAMLTIMAAFAQLERDTMIERTRAGLAAAAANGRKGGGVVRIQVVADIGVDETDRTGQGRRAAPRQRPRWPGSNAAPLGCERNSIGATTATAAFHGHTAEFQSPKSGESVTRMPPSTSTAPRAVTFPQPRPQRG